MSKQQPNKISKKNIKKLPVQNIVHLSLASLPPVINLYFQISLRIFVKIRNSLNEILSCPGENDS